MLQKESPCAAQQQQPIQRRGPFPSQ
jgi:hypothetical protein